MAGRDITEGRSTRAIAVDIGVVASTAVWQNTDVSYDVAIGGIPFIYAINDARPYARQTAPFKKDQFDNGQEPGEQSLTGWWIRSQQSFHSGSGIKFFDPATTDVNGHYRFADSKGVNVWTKGQVTLLNNCSPSSHYTTGMLQPNGRANQQLRSIKPSWTVTNKALTSNVATLTVGTHQLTVGLQITVSSVDSTFNGTYTISAVTSTTISYAVTATNVSSVASTGSVTQDAVLLWDEYDIDKIMTDGSKVDFIDYNTGVAYPVYAICDDGTYAYWVTNVTSGGTTKLAVYKKPLTGSSASTADEVKMFDDTAIVTNATMEYVKERIVMCVNNKVYEFSSSASALPTPVYTHPASSHVYTSVAASGAAIYVSGYNGIQSTIVKFTLNSSGVMPTLTSAVVAAELPVGEVVHKVFYYLGYMMIGTNKGVRAATVSDTDGSLSYGPLIVETSQPCYDFAARDHFVWCATSVDGDAGLIRVDLSNELETLRFAYANDVYMDGVSGAYTTSCAFADGTNRITFCTSKNSSNGQIYIEDSATLRSSGYVTTGNIRFGTLEPKNFKRLLGRGDFTYGSLTLETVDKSGVEYDHISYDGTITPVEVTTSSPATAQEYVAYKFILYRDGTTTSAGPVFKGYQAKATIATPRQRIIQFPVFVLDVETDRYNVETGYQGRALERLQALENIEEGGDVITWQDLTTGESRQAVVEQIQFTRLTPPDKSYTGFGGVATITIRTV